MDEHPSAGATADSKITASRYYVKSVHLLRENFKLKSIE